MTSLVKLEKLCFTVVDAVRHSANGETDDNANAGGYHPVPGVRDTVQIYQIMSATK